MIEIEDRELFDRFQPHLQEHMHASAVKHASLNPKLLYPLGIDPTEYKDQSMRSFTIKGSPIPYEAAHELASKVDPRYPKLFSSIGKVAASQIAQINEFLKDGINAANGSDHAELIDIALSHLALGGNLKTLYPDTNFRSGIIVSKMVDFLGVHTAFGDLPARDLLAMAFDECYLTIPRTNSTNGMIDESAMRFFNRFSRLRISQSLVRSRLINSGKPPFLLGLALPGSVTKPLDVSMPGYEAYLETTKVMGKINPKVIEFLEKCFTYTSAVRPSVENPGVFFSQIARKIKDEDALNLAISELVTGMNELDSFTTLYDQDSSLPVIGTKEPESSE